jgi:flagellar basal body P-ring protein FlgI
VIWLKTAVIAPRVEAVALLVETDPPPMVVVDLRTVVVEVTAEETVDTAAVTEEKVDTAVKDALTVTTEAHMTAVIATTESKAADSII